MATAGVFQYFFWVLLQPFRGYPTYKEVVEAAYNSSCLQTIDKSQTDMKELGEQLFIKAALQNTKTFIYVLFLFIIHFLYSGQCIVETLYNTSCIADKLNGTQSIQENEINSCLIDKDAGYG